jgi:hypothetical protein
VPGILNLEPTDESVDQARPAPKPRNKKLGYFLGVLVSTIAAILVAIFILEYLQMLFVHCFMSLGCSESKIPIPLLLAPAGYLLLAIILAGLARVIFNSRLGIALLLNIAPLVVLMALYMSLIQYRSYSYRTDKIRAARTSISDAPAIHLGDPFVRIVDDPDGGVTIFLHVPFTVSRTIQARSLAFLATLENSPLIKFSPKPECSNGYEVPAYGFHVVDREYFEPPLPIYVTGTKIVSEQLEPNKQYYLLQERHFDHSSCRASDYREFEPKQLRVTLTTSHAEAVSSGSEW